MKFLLFVLFFVAGGYGQVDYETTPRPLAPTSFSCLGRPPGYYADLETGCRTYHVCDGNSHFTYICPRRTLFQQRMRICDHSYLVRCEDSYLYDDDIDDEYPEDVEEGEETFDEDDFQGSTSIEGNGREELNTTEVSTTETIQTTSVTSSQTTTERVTDTTKTDVQTTGRPEESSAIFKYLRFTLKDFRSLFYIPEVDNNLAIVEKPATEFVLPIEGSDIMKFKNTPEVTGASCPAYCNPRFFQPGTCHPCVMIK